MAIKVEFKFEPSDSVVLISDNKLKEAKSFQPLKYDDQNKSIKLKINNKKLK